MCVYAYVQSDESRDHVEVCAEGGVIIQQLARRVAQHGGAALIADYGHGGTKTDTFRVEPRRRHADLELGAVCDVIPSISIRGSKVTISMTSWHLPAVLTSRRTWISATCGAWRERVWPASDRWLRGLS